MEEEKDKSKGAAAEMCWNWDEVFTPDHQCGDVESVVAKPLEDDKEIAMVAEKVKSVEIEKVLEIVESPKVEEVLAPPRTLTAYLCYNCNGEGHFARECPFERPKYFCYNCRGEGHFARECPAKCDQ